MKLILRYMLRDGAIPEGTVTDIKEGKHTEAGWRPHISPPRFNWYVWCGEISISLQWPLLHVNTAGGHREGWMSWQGRDTWDTSWINDLCIMGNLKPAVTNTAQRDATVKILSHRIHLDPDLHKKATVMNDRSVTGESHGRGHFKRQY